MAVFKRGEVWYYEFIFAGKRIRESTKTTSKTLAKEAEKIRPGLKILFISGHPERAGSGLDPAGVTNLLMQPFTADTLAARIKDMLAGRTHVDGRSA